MHVEAEHIKYLVDQELEDGVKRPLTPDSQRGLTQAEKSKYNLNPQKMKIYSETEAEYLAELLIHQMDDQKSK